VFDDLEKNQIKNIDSSPNSNMDIYNLLEVFHKNRHSRIKTSRDGVIFISKKEANTANKII
jgi:hypothetical protein